jgi:hypothetical protein
MSPTNRRVSLSLAVAIAACLAAPMAMAQSTDTAADPATAAQDATAVPPTSADASAGATSWNDLDTDMDGRISKTEAVAMPALEQVFDQADADGDGALTSEEYQSYVANQGAATETPPQG